MKRTVLIDGIEIEMKCSARTVLEYRKQFNRELMIEFARIRKFFVTENGRTTIADGADFSIIENLAYVMAKQANPDIGSIDEWLDQFNASAIFDAMDDILSLYVDSMQTTSDLKKKKDQLKDN